jgi:hypothetical protein
MTQQSTNTQGSTGAVDTAREQGRQLGHSVTESGSQVAQTAAEQAQGVAAEAGRQARDLVGEARGQVTEQVGSQQQKVVGGLRSLGDELTSMAVKGGQAGPATELAHQAADGARRAADWLEQRQPGDLLEELRRVARQRPGMFLLGAAVTGVLAGRLTRAAAARSSQPAGGAAAAQPETRPIPRESAPTEPMRPVPEPARLGSEASEAQREHERRIQELMQQTRPAPPAGGATALPTPPSSGAAGVQPEAGPEGQVYP